jgi:hypothetical protein
MMNSDVKTVGWWIIYAVLLMLISGTLYVTMPRRFGPIVSVEAKPAGFEPAGTVEIRFRLRRPASAPLTIPYDLEGDAERGRDYDLADPAQDPVVIPAGEQVSPPVILRKTAPAATGDDARETGVASVVVALKAPAGSSGPFRPDPRASRVELPIEIVRPGRSADPFTISLAPDATAFSDGVDKVMVEFRLDHKPRTPVAFRFKLGGTAIPGKDYEVKDRPAGDLLRFAPEQDRAALILERRQGSEAARGQGDRTIEVAFEANTRFRPGKGTDLPIKITVPDPKATLAWSVDPSVTLDRRAPSTARLHVTLNRPISDPVTVRYTTTLDPDLVFDGPPADPEGRREITLAPGTVSAEHEFKFPVDEVVGGPTRRVRLEPAGVTPKELADTAELAPLEITTADDQPLGGHALVLVIYSADLAANGPAMIRELKMVQDRNRDQLVGGSLYLLAGDKAIYRLPTDADTLGKRPSFALDVDYETILNAAVDRVQSRIDNRAVEKAETILVWEDLSEKAKVGADQRKFVGFPDLTWQLVWIGPPREKSKLAAALEKVFRPMLGKAKFLGIGQTEGRLAGALGAQVRGGR